MAHDIKAIANSFCINDTFVNAIPYGTGHINETFKVDFANSSYIFQRVNTNVFKQPEALMDNFVRVTDHIQKKIDIEKQSNPTCRRSTLKVIYSKNNTPFYYDEAGNFWRCYVFVDQARTYDILETPKQAYEAACAFGNFQLDLADMPGRLAETIPNFHNTPSRLAALEAAAAADKVGRLKEVSKEYDFVMSRRDCCSKLIDLMNAGELVERTTHNDTKLNNVLIDDLTGTGVCVIDLDTVMPGLPHYDFGDMVRTGTSPAAEDEKNLDLVGMRFEMFEALLKGYLSSAGKFLNPLEKELLPFSGKLITLEIGIRFLTDYLEGDVYFRTHRLEHNLDRCRTQFKLVESIESQLDKMKKLLDE